MRALLASCVISAALAQQAPQVRLEGSVVDQSGRPLAGVTVRVTGKPVYERITGQDGSFVIDDIVPGMRSVSVERAGYLPVRLTSSPSGANIPINVAADSKLDKLNLVMIPQGVIAGRVTDSNGDPVAGLKVHAVRWAYEEGQRRLLSQGTSAVTDERGEYRITNLGPGRYYVYLAAKFLPTYFPNSLNLRDATQVEIQAGAEARANIRWRDDQLRTIRGRVLHKDGTPASSGVVLLFAEDQPTIAYPREPLGLQANREEYGPYTAWVSIDSQGRFELPGVPAGTHRLMAIAGRPLLNPRREDFAMYWTAEDALAGTLQVQLPEGLNEVAIPLDPLGKITAMGRIEGGSWEQVMRESNRPGRTTLELDLVPETGFSMGGRFRDNQATVAMRAGRYFLRPTVPKGYYLKSVLFQGNDVTKQTLDFKGGSATLELLFAKGDLRPVRGVVRDSEGKPVPHAIVAIWDDPLDRSEFWGGAIAAIADQNGAFEFSRRPPGSYHVAAFEALPEPGLELYPDFLERFAAQATRVRLEVGGTATADVKLIPRQVALQAAEELPQ